MRAILLALLLLPSVAWADQLTTRDDPFTGFPTRKYCSEEFGEYRASAGTLSTSGDPFFASQTGTGANLEDMTPYTGPNGATIVGAVREELGTVATNDSGVRTSTVLISLGRGAISFYFTGREIMVSDGTNTFSQRVGLIDTDSEPTDGVFFRYTHSVNSGKWQAVVRDAGTETATDTGVTFTASTNRTFQIDINAAGTSAVFQIDGVTVHTDTGANLPDATDYTGFGFAALRSVGTAADVNPMAVDYMAYRIQLTTPRC